MRNALQPANGLPPEIISRIVRSVPDEIPADTTHKIVPLTHVCQYWREVIISTPEHWTSISTESGRNLAMLYLERAKTAPLEIHLDGPHIREDYWPELLRPNIRNTGSLCVAGLRGVDEVTTAFPNFPQSAPNLRSLKLVATGILDLDQSVDPFGSSAHSLRSLTLKHVPFYPSFLNLRTLTTLCLTDHSFNLHFWTFWRRITLSKVPVCGFRSRRLPSVVPDVDPQSRIDFGTYRCLASKPQIPRP